MSYERLKLASDVREAIQHIRACMCDAQGPERDMLEEDLHGAMDDYMNLMDEDSVMSADMDEDMVLSADMDEDEDFDEDDMEDDMEDDDLVMSMEGPPEHRDHVAYVLDKVADVMESIETVEMETGRIASASRTRLANYVKELSSVVANTNMRTASAGDRIASVGVKVIAMRSEFVD